MHPEREKKLEEALAQFIRPIKGIPFEVVVKGLFNCEVLPFSKENGGCAKTLSQIVSAMRAACEVVRCNPIKRRRPNEVGNDMEPYVIDALRATGLKAGAPRTIGGKGKSTGYPDIRVELKPYPIYFEVKTYAAANRSTTHRSFFLSPSDDPKVVEDACHLLAGFEFERSGDLFTPSAYEIVDLYGLDCDMKSEFNSDNRRLYESSRILAREKV